MLAMPDANTFEVLPWGDPKATEARVFCDIHNLDGTPFEGDPRQVLRRNLQAAHERGFTFFVAPDIEFFYFSPPEKGQAPVPLDEGGFFDLTTTDVAGTLRKQTIRTLETMSIPVEYSFHEDAPSQHEIDLRHTDALTMADSIMTFRLVVKEVAASQGVHATFMPKPLESVQGSGMHVHLSLFDGDENAFYSDDDSYNLSPIAKQFMAGLLRHAAEITAITNQTVNSYKRLVPGFEAPVHVTLGAQQPQRPGPRAGRQAGQPQRDTHRVPLARPGLQPVPGVRRHARRRHARHHRGVRAAARGRQQPVRDERRGARQARHRPAAAIAQRFAEGDGAVDAGARGAGRAHLRMVPAQQAQRVAGVQDARQCLRARPIPASRCSAVMEQLVVYPEPPPPDLARTLDLGGYRWKAVGSAEDAAAPRAARRMGRCDRGLRHRPRGCVGVLPVAAQARRADAGCCCCSAVRSSTSWSCATTCSTTSA